VSSGEELEIAADPARTVSAVTRTPVPGAASRHRTGNHTSIPPIDIARTPIFCPDSKTGFKGEDA